MGKSKPLIFSGKDEDGVVFVVDGFEFGTIYAKHAHLSCVNNSKEWLG